MRKFYMRRMLALTMLAVLALGCATTIGRVEADTSSRGSSSAEQQLISGDDSESQYKYAGPAGAGTTEHMSASCITTRTEISCELP